MQSFWEFINRKPVRMALAAFCLMLAIQGAYLLFAGTGGKAIVRGGGEVLLWGGWAVVNVLHPFGRTIAGIHLLINVGLAMVVVSWFMK